MSTPFPLRALAVCADDDAPTAFTLDDDRAADVALVIRVGNGDASALGALYERFGGVVLGVAERIIGIRREAEDLLHDVFLEVWQRAGEYDPARATVRTWLLLRTRSRAIDRRRSSRISRSSPLDAAPEVAVDAPEPGGEARAERLRVAFAALPVEQQQALHLAYFEGLSATEIASTLCVPVGTVKSRVASGRARLRRLLTTTPKRAVSP